MKYQGSYMDSELAGLKDHAKHYPSSGYIDELAWGNLWVYWATQVSPQLQDQSTTLCRKQDTASSNEQYFCTDNFNSPAEASAIYMPVTMQATQLILYSFKAPSSSAAFC